MGMVTEITYDGERFLFLMKPHFLRPSISHSIRYSKSLFERDEEGIAYGE